MRLTRVLEYARLWRRETFVRYAIVTVFVKLLPEFSAAPVVAHAYRLIGCRLGPFTCVSGPMRLIPGGGTFTNLRTGERVIVSTDVTINLDDVVHLHDNVAIGPRVAIYTSGHALGPGSRRMMPGVVSAPVEIGRGSWIGLGAVILPGVTVGPGSVVAAGSVVASDIPPNSYAIGNPAEVTRTLPWGDR
ncbi:MAG: hypothetical protein HKN41_05060 [Ilumatobacter sp.]|nr:hypothetical protein [Ilumatobacter sp.]